jgi:hypothetical protein
MSFAHCLSYAVDLCPRQRCLSRRNVRLCPSLSFMLRLCRQATRMHVTRGLQQFSGESARPCLSSSCPRFHAAPQSKSSSRARSISLVLRRAARRRWVSLRSTHPTVRTDAGCRQLRFTLEIDRKQPPDVQASLDHHPSERDRRKVLRIPGSKSTGATCCLRVE